MRKLSECEDGDGGAKLQKGQLSETSIKVEPVRPGLPLPVFTTPVPKKTSEEGGPDGPGSSSGGACGGKQSADDAISEAEETNNCKRRRTWELWGPNEKHIFFEALNEYGKDFDKIQSHFQAKLKNKRNMPAHYIKNKNQIRHFYYRTWHKIANHIHFTSELTKNSRELIGLINYGELWKKIGGTVDEKFGQKLDDLVQNGTAALKVKGKSQRVKTPVCRALKKVYGKADSVEKTVGKAKLPSKVVIELCPRSTSDWCRVQRLAQNPHVRITLATSRRLQTLIRCLEKKWRSVESKMKQGLRKEEGEEHLDQLVLMPIRGAVIKEDEELVVTEVKPRPKVKIKLTGLADDEVVGADQEGSKFEEMLGLQRASKEEEDEDEEDDDGKREKENGGINGNGEMTKSRSCEEMLGQFDKEENGDEVANTSIDTCEENSNDEPNRSQEEVAQSPRLERVEEEDEGGGEVVEEFLFDLSDPECSRSPLPTEDLEEIDGMEDEEDAFKEEDEEVIKEEEEEVKEEMKLESEDKKWGDPRQGWSLSEAR